LLLNFLIKKIEADSYFREAFVKAVRAAGCVLPEDS
jgi:hypothetical protein